MTIYTGLGEEQTTQVVQDQVGRGTALVPGGAGCWDSTACVPLFQHPVETSDGKCGCEFRPETAAMGVFLLPAMPALMLIQKQCGALGRGGESTICKTINSPSMAIPGLALNLVGWWLIYKYLFKGGK